MNSPAHAPRHASLTSRTRTDNLCIYQQINFHHLTCQLSSKNFPVFLQFFFHFLIKILYVRTLTIFLFIIQCFMAQSIIKKKTLTSLAAWFFPQPNNFRHRVSFGSQFLFSSESSDQRDPPTSLFPRGFQGLRSLLAHRQHEGKQQARAGRA